MTLRPEEMPLLKIQGSISTMNPAVSKLAQFILDHPQDVVNSTIESLAEKSDSSYATISRFCKKLGYSGFKEFKSQLIEDMVNQQSVLDGRGEISIDEDSSAEEVIEKIFRFSAESLRKTEAIADSEQIEQAAEVISGCRRVLFIGAGTSGISARYAFSRFFRLGIPCSAEVDPVLYYMQSSILGPEDVLFAVSSSGRTSVVVEAARAARQSGATVVCLSDFAISPLSQIANIKLYTTPRNVNLFMELEMPLLLGQITLIDVLFSIVSLMTSGETKARYAITKQTADRMKNR